MNEEGLTNLKVVKRNGKKVDFDGTKIAVAIKKGFDNLKTAQYAHLSLGVEYTEKDSQKVFQAVMKRIEKDYKDAEKIKIEEIQDMIEDELKKKKYTDVYESFADYREKRRQSREMFVDDKKMHKFLKTIEGLGLKSSVEDNTKRENANVNGDTAMGTMLQYGSTVSKEFAKAYLMKKKFADTHDKGHEYAAAAFGSTETCEETFNERGLFYLHNIANIVIGNITHTLDTRLHNLAEATGFFAFTINIFVIAYLLQASIFASEVFNNFIVAVF